MITSSFVRSPPLAAFARTMRSIACMGPAPGVRSRGRKEQESDARSSCSFAPIRPCRKNMSCQSGHGGQRAARAARRMLCAHRDVALGPDAVHAPDADVQPGDIVRLRLDRRFSHGGERAEYSKQKEMDQRKTLLRARQSAAACSRRKEGEDSSSHPIRSRTQNTRRMRQNLCKLHVRWHTLRVIQAMGDGRELNSEDGE
jgi:hypothetical protein